MIKRHYFISYEAYSNRDGGILRNGFAEFDVRSWRPDPARVLRLAMSDAEQTCMEAGHVNFRIHVTAFSRV